MMMDVLSMYDLPCVQVAEGVDELVQEILGFGYGQSLSLFDQFEHVLGRSISTPLEQISNSM